MMGADGDDVTMSFVTAIPKTRFRTSLVIIAVVVCASGINVGVELNNSWTGGAGPEGGQIMALTIDPITPTTLYAGLWARGLFKSTNGGATWNLINTGLTSTFPTVNTVAIDPASPNTIYAGTSYDGIFKSTNAGANWIAINNGLNPS